MANSLLEKYKLQKRLEVIESLIAERSIGRGGEPSNAMNVWQLLTDNGPMTKQQIQNSGLSATATATASLNFYVANNLLTKTGDRFVANPDYAWDDVGVIPRTAQQELMNSLRDVPIVNDTDEIPVEPITKDRTTRQHRVKEVKQNLFSRKYDEVKAAIDAGQDCRVANDNGVTPLVYACRDTKNQSADIVKLLLDHGANPNLMMEGITPLGVTAVYDCPNMAELLVNNGADLELAISNGDTALIIGARDGSENTVAKLISLGADVNAKNKSGKTAMSVAKTKQIANMLKKAGATE